MRKGGEGGQRKCDYPCKGDWKMLCVLNPESINRWYFLVKELETLKIFEHPSKK